METTINFESQLKEFLTCIVESAIRKVLTDQSVTNLSGQPLVKEILTLGEAADYIDISKSQMYKLTSTRAIPHYTTGKKLYFKRDELVQWATKHRVKTRDDIEMEAATYIVTHKRR